MFESRLREMYRRFNEGDLDGATSMLHPNAELHQNPELPGAGVYRGREEFRGGFAQFLDEWGQFRLEVREAETGEETWLKVRVTSRGRSSGVPLEMDAFHVWSQRDGLPLRCRIFLVERESRDAAGLEA